ncbi:MAG: hypothetical protein AB7T18_17755 [Alphaproteobacteria bacterium]
MDQHRLPDVATKADLDHMVEVITYRVTIIAIVGLVLFVVALKVT